MNDFIFKDEKYKHLQIVDILLTNDNQIVNVYFKYPSGLLDNRLFNVSEIEVITKPSEVEEIMAHFVPFEDLKNGKFKIVY